MAPPSLMSCGRRSYQRRLRNIDLHNCQKSLKKINMFLRGQIKSLSPLGLKNFNCVRTEFVLVFKIKSIFYCRRQYLSPISTTTRKVEHVHPMRHILF